MRITVFTNSYKPSISGVVTSIDLFRMGLLAKGHQVSVIVPEYGNYEDEEPYIFRVPAIDFSQQVDMTFAIPLRGMLRRTVSGLKPHVIHSQHPMVMGGLAASYARQNRLPLVFTFHTRYEEYAHKYIKFMPELAGMVMDEVVERYLGQCSHIIAPTSSIRDLINRKYNINVPVTVVPTPVDLSNYSNLDPHRIRAKLGLEECEMLLYVGRLSEEKNLAFLIKSFALFVKNRPSARLVLVGRGVDETELRTMVDQLNLAHQVIFTGPVPFTEVPHYAAAADLFVFPSKTDTQGLVLVEAMAAGTPVLAVEAESSRDVLAQGGGVLVEGSLESFAGALHELLADRSRLNALSDQALQVAQRYDIPTAVDKLIGVYEEAISYASLKVK